MKAQHVPQVPPELRPLRDYTLAALDAAIAAAAPEPRTGAAAVAVDTRVLRALVDAARQHGKMLTILGAIREDALCGGQCQHIPSGLMGDVLAAVAKAEGR